MVLSGFSSIFRNPRVTASRCGASKSKSLVERDKSNVLLLRDIGRSSLSRREHQSLSHRRLRRRASAGDALSVRFRTRNCHATFCTVLD